MGANLNLRFCIGSDGLPQTNVWKVWSNKNDVYLAARSPAGTLKISLHQSRLCRLAFDTKTWNRPEDRAQIKWERACSPSAGKQQAVAVLRIAFPRDYLSAHRAPPDKPTKVIAPPEMGFATIIEMSFSAETPATIEALLSREKILIGHGLPNGETFFASLREEVWDARDLRMPANGSGADLLFSALDPDNTGRPIRLTQFFPPRDGVVHMVELGGHTV